MICYDEDILREILLRLPAKSLIKFKLVCKHWFSLISSHQFLHLHTMNHFLSKSEPSFLLRHTNESRYFHLQCSLKDAKLVPYDFPPTLCNTTIRSVSNGLFLLVENGSEQEHCYVYNPTTKQSRKILINSNKRYAYVIGLNIAFDPSKSPHYRIICIRALKTGSSFRRWISNKSHLCKIEAYDSGTNTWGNCGAPFSAPPRVDFNFGVLWNNSVHWSGKFLDLDDSIVEAHPEVVVPFSLHFMTETLEEKYTVSNSYLYYIAHLPEEKVIVVFELQKDCSQWLLKYQLYLDQDFEPVSVLSFIKGDSEEDSTLLFHQSGKVMAYGFEKKSFKEVIDFKEEKFYEEIRLQFVSRFSFPFFETLVPLD